MTTATIESQLRALLETLESEFWPLELDREDACRVLRETLEALLTPFDLGRNDE